MAASEKGEWTGEASLRCSRFLSIPRALEARESVKAKKQKSGRGASLPLFFRSFRLPRFRAPPTLSERKRLQRRLTLSVSGVVRCVTTQNIVVTFAKSATVEKIPPVGFSQPHS